ncbi:MAG: putative caspase-like protein [Halieaceae bacterium]|jgi:uncharacterized caspase-like protein
MFSINVLRLLAFTSLLLSTTMTLAYEEALPRYALIIGNGDYDFSPLKNPANDARDMAKKLRKLRYKVTLATDQEAEQLRTTVVDFYKSIDETNAVSLFYYAGHAVQLGNSNYLIPVAAEINSEDDIRHIAYSMNDLLSSLRNSNSDQNIIILDACRNNPFMTTENKQGTRGLAWIDLSENKGFSEFAGGLAPVEAPPGTLVAYATEPGNVADDGRGRNGTYTKALLRHIGKAETAEALFKKVRKDVLKQTRRQQTPWEHSSLVETFYFSPPKSREVPNIVAF